MANTFISPVGDLQRIFVDDYALIDQYAKTGSLWVWGVNTSGELGDNSYTSRSSPVQIAGGGTNWKQVSFGYGNSAAIKTDGTLWTWGLGGKGTLGDNTVLDKLSPVQTVAGGTNWKQVSCCYNHVGAIKTDGTLWMWGFNFSGQLGNNLAGNFQDKSSPVQTVAGGTNWKQVSCGTNHTAAIKTDGTLWTWGDNLYGQLGDNTGGNSSTWKSSPVQTVAGGTNWKQVAAGGQYTVAIKTDGTLWTWGENSNGQLGDNTVVQRSSPVQIAGGGTNWKQVDVAQWATTTGVNKHTVAIKTNGTLWTWGNNTYGQLGDNTVVSVSSPIQTVAGGTNWKQVACGRDHTAAIKTDGTLWTWGNNSAGELGDNTRVPKSSPIQTVAGGTNWKQVSFGNYNMSAIHFYDANNLYPNK